VRHTDPERLKRRDRKRVLGSSSAMPDDMRHHYREGERAALCLVAFEVKRKGNANYRSTKSATSRASVRQQSKMLCIRAACSAKCKSLSDGGEEQKV
jgi:hypothetical protein